MGGGVLTNLGMEAGHPYGNEWVIKEEPDLKGG
jgi:hypothetical protein